MEDGQMGKRSRQFVEDERFVRCHVCHEDIAIEYYLDRDDVVCCDECDSEYVLQSRNPVKISLIVDDIDDDESFFDDYSGKGYD
jgi:hypothetical protein